MRLSGQDVERGTFSHRHAVVHDQKKGEAYTPLEHVFHGQRPKQVRAVRGALRALCVPRCAGRARVPRAAPYCTAALSHLFVF